MGIAARAPSAASGSTDGGRGSTYGGRGSTDGGRGRGSESGSGSESAESSDADERAALAARRKMGVRGLMLRYLLYDAVIRPDEWHFARLHHRRRADAWERALQAALARAAPAPAPAPGGAGARADALCLAGAAELPIVPLLLARQGACASVRAYEPLRPLAAALARAAEDNGLQGTLRVVARSAAAERRRRRRQRRSGAKEGGDGARPPPAAALVAAPALEEATSLRGALEELRALRAEGLVTQGAAHVPARVQLLALPVELPVAQVQPVRAPLGRVSGFDLAPFNALRPAPVCADRERLKDVKHRQLAPVASVLLELDARSDGPEAVPTCSATGECSAPPLRCEVRASADGTCNAIALWVAVDLCGDSSFQAFTESRRALLIHLRRPVPVRAGEQLQLTAAFDESSGTYHAEATGGGQESDGGMWLRTSGAAGAEGELRATAQPSPSASSSVSRWHFGMVNDAKRNDVYEAALRDGIARVKRDKCGKGLVSVLDIGGGSGLLAMMAARHGADETTCVEVVPAIASAAREVLATNGLQDAVRVLEAHSSSLSASELGFGGGARCDVLVSEVLDDGLLGEHVIPTVAHARRQLCTSDALVIPARAAVRARLVSVPRQAAPVPAPSAAFGGAMVDSGGNGATAVGWDTLDVSAYDALRPKCAAGYFSARMHRLRHTVLSDDVECLTFDFNAPLDAQGGGRHDPSSAEYSRRVRLPLQARRGGVANAVAFHFTLGMLPEGEEMPHHGFTSAPEDGECTWSEALQFLDEPIEVTEGQQLTLTAGHTPTRVFFDVED